MDKGTVIRIIVFCLAWSNTLLASKGFKTLPVLDETQVALGVTLVISVWGFIKHNFLGQKGKDQKEVLDHYNLK